MIAMNECRKYLTSGHKGHLIGIGGVSMAPLAEVLLDRGLRLTGSDIHESQKILQLRSLGIPVRIGHAATNLDADTEFVVRTAAVHDENPEIAEAHRRGIPVFERAEAWGAIMQDYRNALCIAGTHGKTTTTSMCTHILMAADRDPTVMIGGTLTLLSSEGYRVGKGDTIVLESCEYYNSFLYFYPSIAVITNIEADHLDFFKNLKAIQTSFREFAAHVPQDTGTVIANADDANTMQALKGLDRRLVTFGMTDRAEVYPKNIQSVACTSNFDIYFQGSKVTDVTLHVPGTHNIYNALAAAAATLNLGVKPSAIKYGLAGFSGANRRFEFKGKYNGADIYDDYAHHPGELKALINMVETLHYERIILVFQPHTYTRTQALFDEFLEQLRRPDIVYLAQIFAAREKDNHQVSSQMLADRLENASSFSTFEEIEDILRAAARPGDIILTVGAGDVYRVGEDLVAKSKTETK